MAGIFFAIFAAVYAAGIIPRTGPAGCIARLFCGHIRGRLCADRIYTRGHYDIYGPVIISRGYYRASAFIRARRPWLIISRGRMRGYYRARMPSCYRARGRLYRYIARICRYIARVVCRYPLRAGAVTRVMPSRGPVLVQGRIQYLQSKGLRANIRKYSAVLCNKPIMPLKLYRSIRARKHKYILAEARGPAQSNTLQEPRFWYFRKSRY